MVCGHTAATKVVDTAIGEWSLVHVFSASQRLEKSLGSDNGVQNEQ